LSLALALTVTDPDTVTPFAGAVIAMVGGVRIYHAARLESKIAADDSTPLEFFERTR